AAAPSDVTPTFHWPWRKPGCRATRSDSSGVASLGTGAIGTKPPVAQDQQRADRQEIANHRGSCDAHLEGGTSQHDLVIGRGDDDLEGEAAAAVVRGGHA